MLGEGRGLSTGRARTFLIVDDDPLQLSSMQRQARGHGRAVVATSDTEALDLARRERPEIAIVDFFLGSTSGVALIAPLRAIEPSMRIVVVSAGFTAGLAEQATRAGADGVIEKPFDLAYALRRIDEGPAAQEHPGEIRSLAEVEDAHIRRVLVLCEFNVSRAARYLGIRPNALRARMTKAGVPTVNGQKRRPG